MIANLARHISGITIWQFEAFCAAVVREHERGALRSTPNQAFGTNAPYDCEQSAQPAPTAKIEHLMAIIDSKRKPMLTPCQSSSAKCENSAPNVNAVCVQVPLLHITYKAQEMTISAVTQLSRICNDSGTRSKTCAKKRCQPQ